ncbi:hypothetical protein B0813_001151 [Candidatus Fervidibacteria bacterium JGI MDM2 SSWTFF-3-K9]
MPSRKPFATRQSLFAVVLARQEPRPPNFNRWRAHLLMCRLIAAVQEHCPPEKTIRHYSPFAIRHRFPSCCPVVLLSRSPLSHQSTHYAFTHYDLHPQTL